MYSTFSTFTNAKKKGKKSSRLQIKNHRTTSAVEVYPDRKIKMKRKKEEKSCPTRILTDAEIERERAVEGVEARVETGALLRC